MKKEEILGVLRQSYLACKEYRGFVKNGMVENALFNKEDCYDREFAGTEIRIGNGLVQLVSECSIIDLYEPSVCTFNFPYIEFSGNGMTVKLHTLTGNVYVNNQKKDRQV